VYDGADEVVDPLDLVGDNVEEIFGSYKKLVQLESYRFEHPRAERQRVEAQQQA
jgi:hypothetical protein